MRRDRDSATHDARAALDRALGAMTVGFERTRSRVSAEQAPLEPGDMQHLAQIPVKGSAGGTVTAFDTTVTWPDAPFLSRLQVNEDDVEPADPQFAFGYELQSDANVIMGGCIKEWIEDERGLIVSARVRIFAFSPGATDPLEFNGVAHLTFTGFAAPTDDDDDGTASTVPQADVPSGASGSAWTGGWGGVGV